MSLACLFYIVGMRHDASAFGSDHTNSVNLNLSHPTLRIITMFFYCDGPFYLLLRWNSNGKFYLYLKPNIVVGYDENKHQ